jgi:hypothetical protein
MALVEHIAPRKLEALAPHSTVECTFDIVEDNGVRLLQLDTYGSKTRRVVGKKSQSLRFSPTAIADLKRILDEQSL